VNLRFLLFDVIDAAALAFCTYQLWMAYTRRRTMVIGVGFWSCDRDTNPIAFWSSVATFMGLWIVTAAVLILSLPAILFGS
jgi:uncharacterized membrane protein YraQ (UPF0718 family)